MEVTTFAIGRREEALLVGDYHSYRSSLTRQLQAVRRRLGRATPKNGKFQKQIPLTTENIKSNREYVKSCQILPATLMSPDMFISLYYRPKENGRMPCR